MSISSAVSVAQHRSRTSGHGLTQVALTAIAALGLMLSSPRPSAAQASAPAQEAKRWEFRITDGALVPTSGQRKFLDDAHMTSAQLSWVLRPTLAITGTFGWARSRDLTVGDAPKLDVFSSDLGVEARPIQWSAGRAVTFSPFAGLGAGVRSYNYRKLDVDAAHNLAGYGAIGGELGVRRVGLRVEVRNYVTGFTPLMAAGKSDARNDVVVMAALSFKKHRATQQ